MVSDYNIDIDLKQKRTYQQILKFNQYDRGVYVKVNLFDDGEPYTIPSTETPIVELSLPKGTGYIISGSSIKDISGNSFRVAIDRNISLNSGEASFNVALVDKKTGTTTRKGSFKNYIKIISNSIDEGTVSKDLAVSIIETLQSNVAKATATETSLRGAIKDGDLGNYAKKTDVINGYVAKEEGKALSTNDFTDAYKTILDGLTTTINDAISTAIVNNNKATHPIHSTKITFNNVNPSTYITGTTWELVGQGKTLIGVDPDDTDFSTAGKTGGSKTHTMTVNELVPHIHGQVVTTGSGGGISGRADYKEDGTSMNTYPQGCNTDSAGGGQPFSILPPYITVYIWERTA